MSISIEQVPQWYVDNGIGHAVASISSGAVYTACQMLVFGGDTQPERPKRICRKCRKALESAMLQEAKP